MRDESKELLTKIFHNQIVQLEGIIKRIETQAKEKKDRFALHEFVLTTVGEYAENLKLMRKTMKKYIDLQHIEMVWRKKLDQIASMAINGREPIESETKAEITDDKGK